MLPTHAPSAEATSAPRVLRITGLPSSTPPKSLVACLKDFIPRASIHGVTAAQPASTFGEALLIKVDDDVAVSCEVLSSVLSSRRSHASDEIKVNETVEPTIIVQHLPGSATLPQVLALVQDAGSPARVLHLAEEGRQSGERYALVGVPQYEDADRVVAAVYAGQSGITAGWVSSGRSEQWSRPGGPLAIQ